MVEKDRAILVRALERALVWHGDQVRKGTRIPYASHLLQVAGLVLEHHGDAEMAAAALLHDAIEDCAGVDGDLVRAEFGPRIAAMVEACTDTLPGDGPDAKAPWLTRKTRYLAHLREVDAAALLVSVCDKRHNLGAIVADLRSQGPDTLQRFNPRPEQMRWYFGGILPAAEGRVPKRLSDELRALLAEFDRLAGGAGAPAETA